MGNRLTFQATAHYDDQEEQLAGRCKSIKPQNGSLPVKVGQWFLLTFTNKKKGKMLFLVCCCCFSLKKEKVLQEEEKKNIWPKRLCGISHPGPWWAIFTNSGAPSPVLVSKQFPLRGHLENDDEWENAQEDLAMTRPGLNHVTC